MVPWYLWYWDRAEVLTLYYLCYTHNQHLHLFKSVLCQLWETEQEMAVKFDKMSGVMIDRYGDTFIFWVKNHVPSSSYHQIVWAA